MNNLTIALIIAAICTFFLVVSESKKENRNSIGIRTFVVSFLASYVALTYLVNDGFSAQDIDTCEPNF